MPSSPLEQREVRSTTPLVAAPWVPGGFHQPQDLCLSLLPPVINLFQRQEKRWLLKSTNLQLRSGYIKLRDEVQNLLWNCKYEMGLK